MNGFPKRLREERGLAIFKPVVGKHVGYYVYDGDTLICVCTYRRGAESLMDYIIANRRDRT